MKIQNYWYKMVVLYIYFSCILGLLSMGYAQGLGPSVTTGAKMDVTKNSKDDPMVWGCKIYTSAIQCSKNTNQYQKDVLEGQFVEFNPDRHQLTIRLKKDTLFFNCPMWGGIVRIKDDNHYQTLDDNLHILLPVCTSFTIPTGLKSNQMVKVTRAGCNPIGAVHKMEVLGKK